MTRHPHAECNPKLLRDQLSAALVQADRCDPMVAIHVETALAFLDEKFGPELQSSSR